VADIVSPAQEATVVGRKKRNPGEVMGGHSIPGPGGPAATGRIVSNALESARLHAHCRALRGSSPASFGAAAHGSEELRQ
jgi:hypothetical protein